MISRKIKHGIIRTAITLLLTAAMPCSVITAWAANASISFSDPSASVGSEVTVTMKVTSTSGDALGRANIMLSYDSSALEFVSGTNASGGAGSVSVRPSADSGDGTEMVTTLTFRPLKAGTSKITISTQEVYDSNEELVTLDHQGDSTVTVNAPEGASSDATLRSLQVSPGTLDPEFSPSVEEYSVQVGEDVSKIAVSAEANGENATVSIAGDSDLQMGDNTVTCSVTAEDGQTVMTYTIHVSKVEGGPSEPVTAAGDLTAVINGVQYTVAEAFDMNTLPEGFEQISYSYKGNEVMAAQGTEKDLLLMYLNDEEGSGDFFIYNAASDTWTPYMELSTTSKTVVILPVDNDVVIPDGFTEGIMNLENGRKASGWVPAGEENPQYWLFYGMNWNGEKSLYRYDLEENTIQRYFQEPIGSNGTVSADQYQEIVNEHQDLINQYENRGMIMIILSVVCGLLLIALIAMGVKARNNAQRLDVPGRTRRRMAAETAVSEDEGVMEEKTEGKEKIKTPETKQPSVSEEEKEDVFEIIDLDEDDSQEEDKDSGDEEDDFEFIDIDDDKK